MKPLEKLPPAFTPNELRTTLQAIIDRVNELSEVKQKPSFNDYYDAPDGRDWATPKRFKANDLYIHQAQFSKEISINGFKSEAEAEAALKALLNL